MEDEFQNYFKVDQWKVIEEGFSPDKNRFAESIMSLGNGHMGLRGNFEERYSGDSLQGTYIAGVYYPDKTVVGWWKIGYPEYYAKVPNATNFIGINTRVNGEVLDLQQWQVGKFRRELNMKEGYLQRTFTASGPENDRVEIKAKRFLSMARKEIAAVSYSITPLDSTSTIVMEPLLDGTITNEDANYDEIFWEEMSRDSHNRGGQLTMNTKKSNFGVATAMEYEINKTPESVEQFNRPKYVSNEVEVTVKAGETLELKKYIGVTTDRDYDSEQIAHMAAEKAEAAYKTGFSQLLAEHKQKWREIWQENDITIAGDEAAQQGIRFNIFHLNQTYTGHDHRLNIGPKGFTGEKYGGATYWDTEAFCLPFYLNSKDDEVAKNLLLYRYRHLDKARENADKLGLDGALYPMVTMNGEESHNEWEITFEEIHRNAAIVYAIHNYIQHTGDWEYLADYGLEVAAAVARFWADRAHYNPRKDKYMIIGVTGPNEYENNVHNNWYTNRMAVWCLNYTFEIIDYLKAEHQERWQEIKEKMQLSTDELNLWQEISQNMYYPYWEEREIIEQQDGYRDKKLDTVEDLNSDDLPLNHNWSWDRILRSPYVKQADVLQGLYFLSEHFDREVKKRNFDFYEPRTVHESSLSPCIYSVIAAEIGYTKKAYELYLRTARLDLENVNRDTEDGLHITSMAGTWLAVVEGFAGKRAESGSLSLSPFLPEAWESYGFNINFQGHLLKIKVTGEEVKIELVRGEKISLEVYQREINISSGEKTSIPLADRG